MLAMLAPVRPVFQPRSKSFVEIWNSSETYAHGYIILPISLWLIWRRRVNFSLLPATPYWPALVPLGVAGAVWLLARLGDVQVVQQYAFAAMLPADRLGRVRPPLGCLTRFSPAVRAGRSAIWRDFRQFPD